MKRYAVAIAVLASLTGAQAAAQEWPNRPVRIVNTFAAGGTADVLSRLMAEHFTSVFGQQFFVETRAGAAGTIGVQSVATAPPDGYNFVLTNVSLLVLHPGSNPKLGYDPKRDLTNIGYIAGSPVVLSVNPASGMRTLADFVVRAKSSPRPLTYSSSGLGSMGHLVAELFAQKAGLRFEHVPYKGASQGLMDLVGGHIAFSAQTVSSTAAQLRSGALVGLAQTANSRMAEYPDLPTFKELGYPDVVSTIWFSLSGPAGLPEDIVRKLNREIARAVNKPEVQQRLKQDGFVTEPMTREEFARFIDAENERWRPILKQVGLSPG